MPPSNDGFKPRYRHFHPQSTVWVQNTLDHDVVYQVADEHNRPFQYRLPAGKISELPGGAVATLGVKALVDELIQNTKADVLRMWDEDVRAKHEATVIVREKSAPVRTDQQAAAGEIDLSVSTHDVPDEAEAAPTLEETFPDAKQSGARDEVKNIANASLGKLKQTSVIKAD